MDWVQENLLLLSAVYLPGHINLLADDLPMASSSTGVIIVSQQYKPPQVLWEMSSSTGSNDGCSDLEVSILNRISLSSGASHPGLSKQIHDL